MGRNPNIPSRYSQLESCVQRHKTLLDAGKLSLPPDQGYPVIFTSGQGSEERKSLAEHAEQLASSKISAFFNAITVIQATPDDVITYLLDPENTHMAFIGNGSFGAINFAHTNSDHQDSLTWSNLGQRASHLKTGFFEQRTCTGILNPKKEVRVALPSFIVANQMRIITTVNHSFETYDGFEEFNRHLGPVYMEQVNSAEQLRKPFGLSIDLGN